jgi:hypothetical protein
VCGEVPLHHAHEIPDVPVQLGHAANGIWQFVDPGVVHGTHDAELKATLHFLHAQMVRVRDLARSSSTYMQWLSSLRMRVLSLNRSTMSSSLLACLNLVPQYLWNGDR